MMWRIRFQGREWLSMGYPARPEGAIFTAKRYEAGVISYAHVYHNGVIIRHGKTIGHARDIEWLARVPANEEPKGLGALETAIRAVADPSFLDFEPLDWIDDNEVKS